jgi:hypothetical protein
MKLLTDPCDPSVAFGREMDDARRGDELICRGERIAALAVHVQREGEIRRGDDARVAEDEDGLDRHCDGLTIAATGSRDGRVPRIDDVAIHSCDLEREAKLRGVVAQVHRDGCVVTGLGRLGRYRHGGAERHGGGESS